MEQGLQREIEKHESRKSRKRYKIRGKDIGASGTSPGLIETSTSGSSSHRLNSRSRSAARRACQFQIKLFSFGVRIVFYEESREN